MSAVYIIAAVTLGYVFGNSVCGFDKLISGIPVIAENERVGIGLIVSQKHVFYCAKLFLSFPISTAAE